MQYGFLHSHVVQEVGRERKRSALNRFQTYEKAKLPPPMVELDPLESLLFEVMNRLGPARPVPMGGFEAPGWAEILAFSDLTGRIDSSEEAELMFDMSRAYCQGLSEGESVFCIPPIERENEQ